MLTFRRFKIIHAVVRNTVTRNTEPVKGVNAYIVRYLHWFCALFVLYKAQLRWIINHLLVMLPPLLQIFLFFTVTSFLILITFITISFPVRLGSIPELPAENCKEIKAGEGKWAVSEKYWFHFVEIANPVLVYCNMKTEGKELNMTQT